MQPDLSPDRLDAVPIDPELMLFALESIAADRARGKKRRRHTIEVCAAAYAEYTGLGVDTLTEADFEVAGALVCRITALAGVLKQAGFVPDAPGGPPREAVIAAASTARLVEVDGQPAFQLLDFLAHANRAATETPR